jgi:membrane-bound ClpP family serine protease
MTSEILILFLLFAIAVMFLIADLFLPSHLLLTFTGVGFLIWAIVRTFAVAGHTGGVIAILASGVFLPLFAYIAIRVWPHTPIGRRIAPPNPVSTAADSSVPMVELAALVGRPGRAVSTLRPSGICEIDGKRVSCIAEAGLIEAGAPVVALRIMNTNLLVAPQST